MKKIQINRTSVQILFAAMTVSAVILELPLLKVAIILTTVLGGVYYCGWACSFGFIQDLGSKLGRKIGIEKRNISPNVHYTAVYMRYILGILTAVITTDLMISLMQFEVRGAFLTLLTGRVPTVAILIVISLFMLMSLKYDRVYCKYICPEGGRYGIMSLLRPFTIKRHTEVCVQCGRCDKACLMQIHVSQAGSLRSPQCINCFECMSACPVNGAMSYGYVFAKSK